MNKFFPEIKKNFGFGCMRLPMISETPDFEQFSKMVDLFIESGFNYFDTAHGYLGGQSEVAVRKCLTSRYPREAYILTNKLSNYHFTKEEEILPLFESQLAACGVEYFDFYLMHAQDANIFEKYKQCHAYETAFELKKQGKVKHVGISFHHTADTLDRILTEYPQIEVVQLQFNYIDYDDPSIQSKLCYEVCEKHNVPVIVMEPVKGGSLANLPEDAKSILADLGGGSPASYAVRFAASFPNVMMVLSGMSDLAMTEDNVSYMKEFTPLDEREREAVNKVCGVIRAMDTVPCTACRYCMERCPRHIAIPEIIALLNSKKVFNNFGSLYYYGIHAPEGRKASNCIGCGQCEEICPQHLKIREILKTAAEEFEKPKEQ